MGLCPPIVISKLCTILDSVLYFQISESMNMEFVVTVVCLVFVFLVFVFVDGKKGVGAVSLLYQR